MPRGERMVFDLFFYALVFGILFHVALGTIFIASLKRGIQGGFIPAFMVQFSSSLDRFEGRGKWKYMKAKGATKNCKLIDYHALTSKLACR
jgi:hypothetical protein